MACDVAIITALQQEYEAVLDRMDGHWRYEGSPILPNVCAWELGTIRQNDDIPYAIVVALIAGAGTIGGALVTYKTIYSWRPRYCFFSGIAGGIAKDNQALGDVALSETIYGYEYGKLEGGFEPRLSHYERCDDALRRAAISAAAAIPWTPDLSASRAAKGLEKPAVRDGPILSGDKVVDDVTMDFFLPVLNKEERAIAVEMEGTGALAASRLAQSEGIQTSFFMIRSISDLPANKIRLGTQKAERDEYKNIAARTAAEFTVEFIRRGLPVPPSGDGIPRPSTLSSAARVATSAFIPGTGPSADILIRSIRALATLQHETGGIPATEPGQRLGIWTTASFLEALVLCRFTPLSYLAHCKKAARYLLTNQNEDGGWAIVSRQHGEGSSTLATGHAVAALESLRNVNARFTREYR